MKFFFIIIVWLFTIFIQHLQACQILNDEQLGMEDEIKINHIDLVANITKQQLLACLKYSINKGLFKFSQAIIETKLISAQQIRLIIENQQKQLRQFAKTLIVGSSSIQPILKWIQSSTQILFTFKLSHRWDSPPCLNIQKQSYNLINNTFEYLCQCIVSRHRIFFVINLEFWKDINSDIVDLKKDGVGTYIVSVKKKELQIWSSLDKQNNKFHIWGEMKERFDSDMRQYFSLIDNITAQEELLKKKKKQNIILLSMMTLVSYMILLS